MDDDNDNEEGHDEGVAGDSRNRDGGVCVGSGDGGGGGLYTGEAGLVQTTSDDEDEEEGECSSEEQDTLPTQSRKRTHGNSVVAAAAAERSLRIKPKTQMPSSSSSSSSSSASSSRNTGGDGGGSSFGGDGSGSGVNGKDKGLHNTGCKATAAIAQVMDEEAQCREELVKDNERLYEMVAKREADRILLKVRAEHPEEGLRSAVSLLGTFAGEARVASAGAAAATATASAAHVQLLALRANLEQTQAASEAEAARTSSVEYLCRGLASKIAAKPPPSRQRIYQTVMEELRSQDRKFKFELKEAGEWVLQRQPFGAEWLAEDAAANCNACPCGDRRRWESHKE
jgi:hypothetical protein